METLPLSEVKARLSEIAEEVHRTHQRVRITRNGRDYVVLMSVDDLESLEATLELLADREAVARVVQAQTDLAEGRQVTRDEVAAQMQRREELDRSDG